MQCSLYGKVPAKRDFIAIGAPREFLNAWEPWLQGAISASRTDLGEKWQSAFLTAPIWRFWLGADICGRGGIGALLSPEFGSQDDWFNAAEALLMSTLDHDAKFEEMTAELGALPPPFQELPKASSEDTGCPSNGPHAMPMRGQNFSELFGSIRLRDHAKIYAGSTFWWTIGGEGIAPVALSGKGMPDPFLFSAMLTGEFAA